MAEMLTVCEIEDGIRLMRWFARHFPSMPNKDLYRLCRGGQIRVNSGRVQADKVLHTGDVVRIPPTISGYTATVSRKTESGERFSLSDLEVLRKCIIHDDDDIVVFNKPAGLAVQGGTGIRKSIDKMAAALFPYAKIALVHRLDKETSGVLVVAKNQHAAQSLSAQFQNKTARKEYVALLNGNVTPLHGIIDNYMIKGKVFDTPERVNDGFGQRPQRAITEYKVLNEAGGCLSWVLFSPHTGRTHQLRLHSAYSLNAPIVGDDLYGYDKPIACGLDSVLMTNNLFLFAYKITLQHPRTGKIITLRAQVPEFMRPVMKFLEFNLPE